MLACDIVQLEERSRLVPTPTPHLNPAQGWFSQLCLLPTYLLQDPGALGIFALMLSDQTLRGLRDGLEWESKQRVDLRWTQGQINQETCPTYKLQDDDGFHGSLECQSAVCTSVPGIGCCQTASSRALNGDYPDLIQMSGFLRGLPHG